MIVSHYIGRVGEWLEQCSDDVIIPFLSTSYEECVQRVRLRREAISKAGGRKLGEFDPERTLRGHYTQVAKVKTKLQQRGHVRVMEFSADPYPELLALLQGQS